MKKIFLIHGWKGNSDDAFFPQIKEVLKGSDFEIAAPSLPNSDFPKVSEWLSVLSDVIGKPNQDTIIVGHSLGGLAVLKFLESIPEEVKVGRIILVSPIFNKNINIPKGAEQLVEEWLNQPLDAEKIKKSVLEIIGFFSDDDPLIPLVEEKVFQNLFGAKTFIEHSQGHYSKKSEHLDVFGILREIKK